AGALVALAASAFERRHGQRAREARQARRTSGTASLGRLVAWHLPAGALATLALVAYEQRLRAGLPGLDTDVLRFSLHPWDTERVLLGLSLVILHAAVLGGMVLVLRGALLASGPAASAGARLLVPALWAASALAAVADPATRAALPVTPFLLATAFVIAAAWTSGAYRLALGRASQAQRLAGFFLALLLPSIVMYPSIVDAGGRARRQIVETRYAADVISQRADLQLHLAAALEEIDRLPALDELVATAAPAAVGPLSTDAAFRVWSQTTLADQRLTSSIELYDPGGALVSRFALNLPDTTGGGGIGWQDATCAWEVFEEVSPFFADERRLLHAGRRLCQGPTPGAGDGWIEVHVMLDYGNLPFITAQNPYVALLRSGGLNADDVAHDDLEFTVYGWSRRPLYVSGPDAWPLTEDVFARIYASRDPFWEVMTRGGTAYDVYFMNDRGAIYALGYPRASAFGQIIAIAELTVLVGAGFVGLLLGGFVWGALATRTPVSGRALLREIRASFYRKLYLAFVLAAVVPVLALAVVTRTYIAGLMRADVEGEAIRTAAAASRVVADFASIQARGATDVPGVDDSLIVWLSRVVAQDVNLYEGASLLGSSERNLFASGLLSTRTPADVYRAIALEGRPAFVGQESVGQYQYLVAAAPVRVQGRDAILTVPLTLRQREIERQIDELDRRVLLAALVFILVGAAIGYSMAERIADPVNRLMTATRRIAAGDLDQHVLATSRDELQRLVDAFNGMAADLRRQRRELERTNRLEAWAEMARQVAHDIKNPLTPIQLNAEHLRRVHHDRGRPLDPVLDECVSTILTQVRLLRQIASEFSSFASSPEARPVEAELGALLSEVVEPYRAGLADRIAIDLQVHTPLPPVRIDRTLVGRAITNVIENALHAMPGAGTLTIAAGPVEGTMVPVVVRDTGMGMDEEAVARLFEPYFSTKATGTGLGLTIARRNIELCGGTIGVQSAPGEGTTVRVCLPVTDRRAPAPAPAA
ncbi:MAG: HAMP domain-containing sensor histidine kinase, partial [Vicinamibacterales bacterium]|nr:HAMP domain-containing sensor histidine kinase [Vicinamibacterales bacterium]